MTVLKIINREELCSVGKRKRICRKTYDATAREACGTIDYYDVFEVFGRGVIFTEKCFETFE